MSFKINPDFIISEHEDGAIILNIKNGEYLDINLTALNILKLIQEGCTQEKIISKLNSIYNADKTMINNSYKKFIESALKNNLLLHIE